MVIESMKYSLRYRLARFASKHGYDFHAETQPDVIRMQKKINALDSRSVNFTITSYPDGSWTATSTNVEGLLTGSRDQSEISEMIKDAIFTYYDIKPEHCKDSLLRSAGEPLSADQSIYVTV